MGNADLYRLLTICLLTTGLYGCLSLDADRTPPRSGPFDSDEVKSYYGAAKDPRRFFLTLYDHVHGPEFKGSNRLHAGQVAQLPFETPRRGSAPVISVSTTRHRIIASLVDTSSSENWIAVQQVAGAAGVALSPPAFRASPEHVRDPVDGYLSHLDALKLDGLRVESVLSFLRGSWDGLGPIARGVEKPEPGLVLGMRFLRPFAFVQFDFPERRITFSTDRAYKPLKDLLLTSAPYVDDMGPLQIAAAIDGKQTRVLLDTAGSFDIILPQARDGLLRHLAIGGLELHDLEIAFDETVSGTSAVPRIGRGVLSRYRMTLDSRSKVVHFEDPSRD